MKPKDNALRALIKRAKTKGDRVAAQGAYVIRFGEDALSPLQDFLRQDYSAWGYEDFLEAARPFNSKKAFERGA